MHARAQILRRHDQWPYQWQVPRRPIAGPILGAGAGARGTHLSASRRSHYACPRAGWLQGLAAGEGTLEPAAPALRLVLGGVFVRSPRAGLALVHRGEPLPFLLWLFDSRPGPDSYAVKLAKRPSQYVKDNLGVATWGMCAAEP